MTLDNATLSEIIVRPASFDDVDLLFHWRNLPEIIKLSSSRRSVSWPEHTSWLSSSLESDCIKIFIAQVNGVPIGQVRLEFGNSIAWLSIYLLPAFCGMGYGTYLIKLITSQAQDYFPKISSVDAVIRNDNIRSISSFSRAGFFPIDLSSIHDSNTDFIHMRFEFLS